MANAISKNYEVVTTFGIFTFTVTSDENGFISVGNIRRNGAIWTSDYPAEVHAAIQDGILEVGTLNGDNPQNFLVADNLLSEIADLGAEAQANARANIGISDFSIGDLTDVDLGGALEEGKMLQVVNGVFTQVDAPAGGGGGFTQEQIEDFVGSMLTDGGGLTWTYNDLTSEISAVVSVSHLSINDHSDVTINAPGVGHVLRFNGANWVNSQLSYNDLSNTPALGTSAPLDAGVGAGEVLLLAQANTLPALDGSALTSLGSIALHSDVDLANPANGKVLTYQNGTLVLDVTAAGYNDDQAKDASATMFADGAPHNGITFTYDAVARSMFAEVSLASSDLTDVDLSNPVNGKVLTYDNGTLVLDVVPEGYSDDQAKDASSQMFADGAPHTGITFTYDAIARSMNAEVSLAVGDLSNVDLANPANGKVLTYDNGGFVLASPITSMGELSDVDLSGGINNGQILKYANGVFVPSDDSILTTQQVEDVVGAMVSGNTETGLSVTYANSKLNFALDNNVVYLDKANQTFTEAVTFTGALSATNTFTLSGAVTFTSSVDLTGATTTAVTQPLANPTGNEVATTQYVADAIGAQALVTSLQDLSDVDLGGALVNGKVLKVINGVFTQGDDIDTDTFLTTEGAQDIVGAMFTQNNAGNTHITFSYDDNEGANDGTITAVVSLASGDLTDGNKVILSDGLNQTFQNAVFGQTAGVDDNSQKLATTLYVSNQISAKRGVTLQPYSAQLTTFSNLNPADGNFIVGDGNGFVVESGADARTSLGLGTAALLDEGDVLLVGAGLNALSDVTIQGSADKQFLVNDGSGTYHNRTISTTDLSNGTSIPLLNVGGELVLTNVFKPNGGVDVNGGKFTIDGATGNTAISGTLNVTGLTTNTDGLRVINQNTGNASISLVSDNDNILITSSGGNIYFDNENLWTTGTLVAGATSITSLSTTSVLLEDNLPSALVVSEGGTPYLTFVTSDNLEKVVVGKPLEAPSALIDGSLSLSGNEITSGGLGVSFGAENISTSGNVTINTNKFQILGASGNTSIGGTLGVSALATFSSGLDANNQAITSVSDISIQSLSANGNLIDFKVEDNQGVALKVTENGASYIEVDTTDNAEEVRILKPLEVDGTLVLSSGSLEDTTGQLDLGNTSVTTLGDLVVQNLTVNGVANTNNQNNLQVADRVIELNAGYVGNNANDLGFLLTRGDDADALVIWDEANNEFALATHSGNISTNTQDFSAEAGFSYANLKVSALSTEGLATIGGNLSVTGTGTILAPAQVANGNQIVTASWVRALSVSDLTGTDESVENIVGAQFTHLNHGDGITFSYINDGGANDGEIRATLSPLLASLSGLQGSADKIFYTSAANVLSESAITQEGRDLLASNDPHAHLNLEIGIDVQAWSSRLDNVSGLGDTADNFVAGDGNNLVLKTPIEARTSLGLDQANARVTLGFGTAVTNDTGDFLAQGSGLDDLDGVTITPDVQANKPLVNQVLVYTANDQWENVQLTSNQLVDGADLIKTTDSISRLHDVDTQGKAEGKILVFNALGNLVVGDKRIEEEVQDFIGNAINAGTQTDITVTYDDLNNKIDFSVDATIARLASPTFTGTVSAPYPANIPQGGDTQIATTKYVLDAVSGGVQGNYQPIDQNLSDISGLVPNLGDFIVGDGNNYVAQTPAQVKATLDLEIGTDVQAQDDTLQGIANIVNGVGANQILYTTGQDTFATSGISANGLTFINSSTNLSDLANVVDAGAIDGHVLRHNGASWVNAQLSAGDLSESVAILNQNQTFTGNVVFEGNVEFDVDGASTFTAKHPANVPVGGDNQIATTQYVEDQIAGFAQDLDGLTDVTIANPQAGQVLRHDGAGQFKNVALDYSDLANVPSLQSQDDTLQGIADLANGVGANQIIYGTAQDTFDVATATQAGRDFLNFNLADPSPQRGALGLGELAVLDEADVLLAGVGLNDLSDVVLDGNEALNHFLVHDGNDFVNTLISTANLSNGNLIPLTNAQGDLALGGSLSATSVSSTGALSGASLSVTGALSGDSLTITNAISGGSISTAGALSAGSMSTGGTLSVTGLTTTIGGLATSTISPSGNDLSISINPARIAALTISQGVNEYLKLDTQNSKVIVGQTLEVSSLSGGGAGINLNNEAITGALSLDVGSLSLSGNEITSGGDGIDFGAEDIITTGSITCTNITFSGDATTIHTQNLTVEDRVIELNANIGANANSHDLGLFFNRGTDDTALLLWDEGDNAFALATHSGAVDSTITTDYSSVAGFGYAPLKVSNLTSSGSITTTGLTTSTLTANGAVTFTSTLDLTGNLNINNKLIVTALNGNTHTDGNLEVGGTLSVTGLSTLAGVNSGNTSITGTLGVSSTATLGATTINGTIGVTGTGTILAPAQNANGNEIITAGWVRGLGLTDTEGVQDIVGPMFTHANHTSGLTFSYIDDGGANDGQLQLALSGALEDISALAQGAGNFIVSDGNDYVAQTPAQVRATLDLEIGTDAQAQNASLQSLADLNPQSANLMLVTDGANSYTSFQTTAYGRGLLNSADAATFRGSISAQESNATLSGLSALQPVAGGNLIYSTGVDTFAVSTITQQGRDLLASNDLQAHLNLEIGTDVQAQDDTLQGIADLANGVGADQIIYGTAQDTFGVTTLTQAGRDLLDDVDASAMRVTLGAQEVDAGLTSIAGLVTGANQMIYTTALDTYATTSLTDVGRDLAGQATTASVRAYLDLEIGTDLQAQDDTLQGLANLANGVSANQIIYGTGQDTFGVATTTQTGRDFLNFNLADPSPQRTALGLGASALVDTTINGGAGENGKAIITDGAGNLGALDGSALTKLGSISTHSDVDVTPANHTGDEVLVWDVNSGTFVAENFDDKARTTIASSVNGGAISGADSFSFTVNGDVLDVALGVSTSNLTDVSAGADTHKQVLRYSTDGGLNKYVPTILGTSTDYDVGVNPNEILLLSTPTQSNVNAVADLIVLGRVIETIDYGNVADAFDPNSDFATDWNGSGFGDSVIYACEDYGVLVS
jgi:hypothetical protein